MADSVDSRGMRKQRRRIDLSAARAPRYPGWLLPRGGAGAGQLTTAAAVVAIGLLVLVIDGHGLSWLAGVIAGGAGGVWFALLRGRGGAAGGDRVVQRTAAAARAERRTEAAVKPLESSGWCFLHDVRGRDARYDHIAVGPGGVILLQSIDPQGTVTISAGEPFVERRREPDAEPEVTRLRPRVLADATAFRDDVQRTAGRRLWVQTIVVFWSEFPAGCVADGRCFYIHGSRLADWMARRPHQLTPAEAEDVFAAVTRLGETSGALPVSVAV